MTVAFEHGTQTAIDIPADLRQDRGPGVIGMSMF